MEENHRVCVISHPHLPVSVAEMETCEGNMLVGAITEEAPRLLVSV